MMTVELIEKIIKDLKNCTEQWSVKDGWVRTDFCTFNGIYVRSYNSIVVQVTQYLNKVYGIYREDVTNHIVRVYVKRINY